MEERREGNGKELDLSTPVVELDDGTIGVVKSFGAYTSTVVYFKDGLRFEVLMPNEDFTIINYINIGYEE
jgi:hypothetical protein